VDGCRCLRVQTIDSSIVVSASDVCQYPVKPCVYFPASGCVSGRSCLRCQRGDYSVDAGGAGGGRALFNNVLPTSQTKAATRPSFITVENSGNGERIQFKAGGRKRLTFRYVCRALDALAERFGLRVYFLTFTLGDDVSVQSCELNRILSFLRMRFSRRGLRFWYAWVIELQRKRYLRFGVKALHWHFAVIAPAGSLPHVEFRPKSRLKYHVVSEGSVVSSSDLFRFWGRGQVFCCYALGRIERYLGKYLGKDDELLASGAFPEFDGFRRFGCSQMGRERLPIWAKDWLAKLDGEGVPVDDLVIRREGSWVRLYGYGDELSLSRIKRELDTERVGIKMHRVREFRSPWRVVGVEYE